MDIKPIIRLTKASQRLNHKQRIVVGAIAGAVLGALVVFAVGGGPASAADYRLPITAGFFYDESFRHSSDHYHPAVEFDSDNPTSVAAQVAGMRYAGMQAAIASWWGQGQHGEATRFPILRDAATAAGLGLIPYYEPEGQANQSVARIQVDLAYLAPLATVRVGGKPVIFVYNARSDTSNCAEVTKWKQATAGFSTWYVNLKVFGGYASCPDQPSSWHQYGPAVAEQNHLPYSTVISPGFWHYNETTPRLARDPVRWAQNVAHLKASTAQWKLVTSWNEWGEATSVEPSPSWQSGSGWGTYADELRRQLVDNGPAPSPSPTATPSPSPTVSPSPSGSPSPTPTTPSPAPTTPSSPSPAPPSPSSTGTPPGSITVLAAGDIVAQGSTGYGSSSNADGWTAGLITVLNPAAVLSLGDNQYESGSLAQYNAGWGRTSCASPGHCDAWGQHLDVMYPAPGNHEWQTAGAAGYLSYFAARLATIGSDTPTPTGATWYSFDLAAWHFVSLDSEVSLASGSSQLTWLAADLAANNGRPTLAYWHHPTWSSGEHHSTSGQAALTSLLVGDTDVQIVLNGHDHDYERFAPMGTNGPAANGIRYWVVGTGGKSHYCAYSPVAGTQVFNCNTYGVLGLTLSPTGYSWAFHPATATGSFTDSGSSGLRPIPVAPLATRSAADVVLGWGWPQNEPLAITAGRKILHLLGVGQ